MNNELIVDIVQRLPQGAISRLWGWLAQQRQPRLAVRLLQRAFVLGVGVDMRESAEPIQAFPSLQDLFLRRLRDDVRTVDSAPEALASPVDGRVGSVGRIARGTLLQAKGRSYSVARLLGSALEADRFEGGSFATLYLAPHNYHRVHTPLAAEVREAVLIPGRLLPVFEAAVQKVDELFARNERVITYLDTEEAGRMAVVKVGATLVGQISTAYDPHLRANRPGQARRHMRYDPPHRLAKGQELGAFALGSTVVLLAEPDKISFDRLRTGQMLRMGQRIGTILPRTERTRTPRQRQPSASNEPSRAPVPSPGRDANTQAKKRGGTRRRPPPDNSTAAKRRESVAQTPDNGTAKRRESASGTAKSRGAVTQKKNKNKQKSSGKNGGAKAKVSRRRSQGSAGEQ